MATLAEPQASPAHWPWERAPRDKIDVTHGNSGPVAEAIRHLREEYAMRITASKTVAVGAIAVLFFARIIGTASAQDKVWRHGLIKAKADAGIFLMVTTRDFAKKQGLKLEDLRIQGRPDRAQGADRRRARQLRGRAAGRLYRRLQGRRRAHPRLPLGGGAARHLRQETASRTSRTSRASRLRCRRRTRCPTCWRARRSPNSASPIRT